MIDEQIRDGDFVIVEDRKTADNGEMVIALVGGTDVTLKKFYRENGRIRLQPANPAMQPMLLDAVAGAGPGRRRRRDEKILMTTHVQADQLHDRPGRPGRSGTRRRASTRISAPSRTRRSISR